MTFLPLWLTLAFSAGVLSAAVIGGVLTAIDMAQEGHPPDSGSKTKSN